MQYYVPGQPYTSTGQTAQQGSVPIYLIQGLKRVLGADEYSYYHSFLTNPDISDPIKSGVAVVLMADLNRWAGLQRILVEDYTSPEILTYVEKFSSYAEGSEEKNLAREEIKKFDKFLEESKIPNRGVLHAAIEESRKGYAVRLATAKRNKSVEELLALETEQMQVEDYKKEIEEQSKVVAQAIEAHMRGRIREYLSVVYEESIGKLFMDETNSKREFAMRMDIIKKVQNNSLNPSVALAQYKNLLDEFAGFLKTGEGSKILGGLYSHPMIKQVGSAL